MDHNTLLAILIAVGAACAVTAAFMVALWIEPILMHVWNRRHPRAETEIPGFLEFDERGHRIHRTDEPDWEWPDR